MPPSKAEKRKSSDRSSSEEREVKEKKQKKVSSEELETIIENDVKEKSEVEMKETKSDPSSGEEKDSSKKSSSGWNNGQLFGSETTETTVQGAGFKDKEKAQETLKMLDGRDISYQFQVSTNDIR